MFLLLLVFFIDSDYYEWGKKREIELFEIEK